MEVQQVRWSFLAELDRKYGRPQPPLTFQGCPIEETPYTPQPPPSRSLASTEPPKLSSTLPRPGERPLPPSMHSARALFTVGRRFKLLRKYGSRMRLVGPWMVTHHNILTCAFRPTAEANPMAFGPFGRIRCLAWPMLETDIVEDRVRWLNNADPWPPPPKDGR